MTAAEQFAIVLENGEEQPAYLHELSSHVGFKYVLASHLDVFRNLVSLSLPASLFILRFERYLNHQLRAYMDIIQSESYAEVPVLFLCNPHTAAQAKTVIERDIDALLVSPFTLDSIATKTGAMLRRSQRAQSRTVVWLEMDHKTTNGLTLDISATGMSIESPDPVLLNKFKVRAFFPDTAKPSMSDPSVVFSVNVRRKERTAGGSYILGVEIVEFLEGPLTEFGRAIGVLFH